MGNLKSKKKEQINWILKLKLVHVLKFCNKKRFVMQ